MKSRSTGLYADARCKQHDTGWGHPECPERFDAVAQALREHGLTGRMERIEGRLALEEEVLLCHSSSYIHRAKRDIFNGADELSTGDTVVCERSWEVALLGAGGVLAAVDAVVKGAVRNAFCVVRPPGHHASPARGMGFCILNNIAIAARYAQKTHGVARVLIADWDVHHGNGTQDVFYDDGTVFFFSTHQAPLYPGTGHPDERGAGRGEGATLNCPFPAGSGRKEILGAFREKLQTAAETFRPDLVLISAGFDSRHGDPLGGFQLSDEDFADLTRVMKEMAAAHAGGRLVSVLEGGYGLDGLGLAASAHVRALME